MDTNSHEQLGEVFSELVFIRVDSWLNATRLARA
jgi:hypothetical protein